MSADLASWLSDRCGDLAGVLLGLSVRLAGLDPDATDLRWALAERSRQMLGYVSKHPCPDCQGVSFVRVADGTLEICGGCLGYGVDVHWLVGAVEL